jgi:hypothetical protein
MKSFKKKSTFFYCFDKEKKIQFFFVFFFPKKMSRFLKTEAQGGLEFSEDLIRTASGHFDISLTASLSLPSLSIRSIDQSVAAQLVCLTSLDISANNLTSLAGIAPLARTLVRLDASYNNITSVDVLLNPGVVVQSQQQQQLSNGADENNNNNSSSFGCFAKLEVLRLQGNMIRDMGSVVQLSMKLPKLRAIYLREQNFKGANPVCNASDDYPEQMAKYFSSKCRCIDGHYFCHEDARPRRLDDGGDNEITLPLSKQWVNESFFSSAVTEDAGEKFGAKSEGEVKQLIGDLKKLLETKI